MSSSSGQVAIVEVGLEVVVVVVVISLSPPLIIVHRIWRQLCVVDDDREKESNHG